MTAEKFTKCLNRLELSYVFCRDTACRFKALKFFQAIWGSTRRSEQNPGPTFALRNLCSLLFYGFTMCEALLMTWPAKPKPPQF